ncbi:GWxTD domain-containing protein [candidate division KSB1 bacterium]
MKYPRRLIAIFVMLWIIPALLFAQDAASLLQQARELKTQGEIDRAISVVEEALKQDNSSAEAHFELGCLHHLKGTAVSLKRAEDALLTALRLSPDTVRFIKELAQVYESRYMYSAANTIWDRVLKLEPGNTDALNRKARIKISETDRIRFRTDPYISNEENDKLAHFSLEWEHFFYDRNMIQYSQQDLDEASFMVTPAGFEQAKRLYFNSPIRWDPHVADGDAEAVVMFSEILRLDPGNRDALLELGKLYFNKVKYQSANESEELYDGYYQDRTYLDTCAFYFQKMTDCYPDDSESHQFLGMAYFRLNEYDSAYNEFMAALSLMSENERAVFENIGLLKVGGLEENRIQRAGSDTTHFWERRDPFYLTQYNERELEHYSRVAEANMRFSNKRRGLRGWQTDQGRILIKYGPPKNRLHFKTEDVAGSILEGRPVNEWEFWHYEDFAFVYQKGWASDNDVYEFSIWRDLNYVELAPQIEQEYPEYYAYEPKGSVVEFHYDALTFRGRAGYTKVEFIYGVPFNNLRFRKEEDEWAGRFTSGIFVFDDAWENVLTDTLTNELRYAEAMIDTASDDLAVDSRTFFFDPGAYTMNVEIMDRFSDNAGSYRDGLFVEEYGSDSLMISDIQLALDIKMLVPDQPVYRDNLIINPTPHRYYRLSQPIFIYYEIYNLVLDEMTNRSDFTVEYTLHRLEEDKSVVQDFVKLLTLNLRQEVGVATSFRYQGNEYEESQFLKIDHKLSEQGPYELTLSVLDNISGERSQKSSILYMFEDKR